MNLVPRKEKWLKKLLLGFTSHEGGITRKREHSSQMRYLLNFGLTPCVK